MIISYLLQQMATIEESLSAVEQQIQVISEQIQKIPDQSTSQCADPPAQFISSPYVDPLEIRISNLENNSCVKCGNCISSCYGKCSTCYTSHIAGCVYTVGNSTLCDCMKFTRNCMEYTCNSICKFFCINPLRCCCGCY